MAYQPVNQPASAMDFSNTIPSNNADGSQKPGMNNTAQYSFNSSNTTNSQGFSHPNRTQSGFSINSLFGRRGQRKFNVSEAPYTHKLSEKHGRSATDRSTTRYFDRKRQTRRVFLDCFYMWLGTAAICGILAGVLAGFSSIVEGLTQVQKYAYNALVTGLSILLGLAFAAQFKQYCEMMRWRFLASSYRTIDDFEDVLSCDSWRTTFRLIFKARRRGSLIPTKAQILALLWLIIFVAFNVFIALIGLTYSIDVSDDYSSISRGDVSVLDLSYIAMLPVDNGSAYPIGQQEVAASTWGAVGQYFDLQVNDTIDDVWAPLQPTAYTNVARDVFWYRFIDLSPDVQGSNNVVTPRTVNSTTVCEEYEILQGGHAGFGNDTIENATAPSFLVVWRDHNGLIQSSNITDVSTSSTTWMTNTTQITGESACGERCVEILALQTADDPADNITLAEGGMPDPKLWHCNNTLTQVTYDDDEGFVDPSRLKIPDTQAKLLAGAIGVTGVESTGDDLQYHRINGDTYFAKFPNATAEIIAQMIMQYTTNTISAMDSRRAPRVNITGDYSPSPAQVVNVKWNYAAAILAGVPIVQFLMLLGVVAFSSKAIILDPSYLTAAHLLYPVMQKLGNHGMLLDVDEMAEEIGPDYKISYAVRPNESDPSLLDTDLVRDLGLVREDEGHGYIRGNQPTGRYD